MKRIGKKTCFIQTYNDFFKDRIYFADSWFSSCPDIFKVFKKDIYADVLKYFRDKNRDNPDFFMTKARANKELKKYYRTGEPKEHYRVYTVEEFMNEVYEHIDHLLERAGVYKEVKTPLKRIGKKTSFIMSRYDFHEEVDSFAYESVAVDPKLPVLKKHIYASIFDIAKDSNKHNPGFYMTSTRADKEMEHYDYANYDIYTLEDFAEAIYNKMLEYQKEFNEEDEDDED